MSEEAPFPPPAPPPEPEAPAVPAPSAVPAASPAAAAPPAPAKTTRLRSFTRMAVGFYGVITLFSIGYALFSSTAGSLFGEHSPAAKDWAWGAGVGLFLVALSRIADAFFPVVGRAGAALSSILGPLTTIEIVVLSLASGFAEELLFRGALWPHLGLAGTSLLFGLVHTLPRRALILYPAFAAVVGLIFGLMRQGTGTVVPCMVAHAIINGLNLAWLERRRRRVAAA